MKKALILTDGKAGHENQSKAVARALGLEWKTANVKFRSGFAKALSYPFDRLGVSTLSLFEPFDRSVAEGVDAVIGTGSGVFYAVKALARETGAKSAVVLYPRGYRISSFDCVFAPAFDRPRRAANVIELPVNPVVPDPSFYEKGVADFEEHYRRVNGRARDRSQAAVAVVIGGPNKRSSMSAEWMEAQLGRILAASSGKALWVTTSRRTPKDVEAVVDSFPWDYKLVYSRDTFNPIPAFVKLAGALYVTAESTGMLSEACSFGSARVIPMDDLEPGNHKFRRFVDDLLAAGYASDGSMKGPVRKADLAPLFARGRAILGL